MDAEYTAPKFEYLGPCDPKYPDRHAFIYKPENQPNPPVGQNATVGVRFGVNFKNQSDLEWIEERKSLYLENGWELILDNENVIYFLSPSKDFLEGWNKETGLFFRVSQKWIINLIKPKTSEESPSSC